MYDSGSTATKETVSLSRAAFVMLRANGLRMPKLRGQKQPLGVAELCLLQRLAGGPVPGSGLAEEVASSVGVPEKSLTELLERLRGSGFLVSGARQVPADRAGGSPEFQSRGYAPENRLEIDRPLVFFVRSEGFCLTDHDGGTVVCLSPAETHALTAFLEPATVSEAFELHAGWAGEAALDFESFRGLAARLLASDVLHEVDVSPEEAAPQDLSEVLSHQRFDSHSRLARAIDRHCAPPDSSEDVSRTPVVPVTFNDLRPPLALGTIIAYAEAYSGGRLSGSYEFWRTWMADEERLLSLADRGAIFLFSNYLWSHKPCREMSAALKARNPHCVTVHGGPNTPKYQQDVERYFAEHPDVDVTVRGEGEATTAGILDALSAQAGQGRIDLSVLSNVPGLSFRSGEQIVHTPDRPQIMDLDAIPSPYLNGLFDAYTEVAPEFAVVETNRGCPFGCTFCDWGSATMSPIRAFDLDRVYAELEWCARHRIPTINVADANFGVWERDVAIAQKVVELKHRYGYPKFFAVNFAKNKVKYLKQIIEMMIDAGIMTSGVLSLQSMDTDTLEAIDRSNIRVDKYDELAAQFREARLPIHVDIMVGLPGQTPESFRNDLQECIDREMAVNFADTQLLVNSPMNEPSYRQRHQIEAGPNGRVLATSSFTREQRREMGVLGEIFELCENFGVLRQVSRWVRQETGIREVDFYDRLYRDSVRDPERWPVIGFTLRVIPKYLVPPGSWRHFIDELRDYLTEVMGLPAASAMETVLSVQHALLPARRRRFPLELELAHDYAAWHREMVAAKDRGNRQDWPELVPPLSDFAPGSFVVDDPDGVTLYALGQAAGSHAFGLSWELQAPVTRPSNFGRDLVESGILTLTRSPAPPTAKPRESAQPAKEAARS